MISDRPAFAHSIKGAQNASGTAAKVLRDAQVAFFRPSAMATQAETEIAQPEPVATAPADTALERSRMRPGSYLDIRV